MLALFDPTLEPEPEPPQDLLKLIPMYRGPKICGAYLPGAFILVLNIQSSNMPRNGTLVLDIMA